MLKNIIGLGKACSSLTTIGNSIGYGLKVQSRQLWANLGWTSSGSSGQTMVRREILPLAMENRYSVDISGSGYSKEILLQPNRQFHAAGSKEHYLDFRYRLRVNHLRLHLLIIRRQKMKKHRRRKFRRKFKALLAKQRLKREIAKEKTFRVELLTMIRKAESFDPREYALQKIAEINNKPKELTREEKLEQLKQLIRENRYQVDYIKPKHRRAEI